MVLAVALPASAAHAATSRACSSARDNDNNGQVDFITFYTYQNGRLHAEATYEAGATKTSTVSQYVYDRMGRVGGKAVDTNGDGLVDQHVYYAYGSDGKLSAEGIDDGMLFNVIMYYSYVGNDRYADVDIGGDGTVDRLDRLTSYYDSQGRLIKQVLDEANDGNIESVTELVYDSNVNLAVQTVDYGADGSVNEVIRYQYGC